MTLPHVLTLAVVLVIAGLAGSMRLSSSRAML
jgi:hypothetical protein